MDEVEKLIEQLRLGDWIIRKAAAEALGRIGDARAIEHLSRTLDDQDENIFVLWGVIEALGNIGDVRAVESLLGRLKDQSPVVRTEAAHALRKVGHRKALHGLRARLRPVIGEQDFVVLRSVRAAIVSIESATAGTSGLPRTAEPEEIPSTTKRPRAAEDAGNP